MNRETFTLLNVDKIIRFDEGNFTDVADAVYRVSEGPMVLAEIHIVVNLP